MSNAKTKATTIDSEANQPRHLVLDAPYSTVYVTPEDVVDHALWRAKQLADLLLAMESAEGPSTLLWLAQQLSDEIVGAMKSISGLKP